MAIRFVRKYKLKFYLNAQHYIVVNGVASDTHPHTWEFCLEVQIGNKGFVPFSALERPINEFLDQFQGSVLNACSYFEGMVPTLETIVGRFAEDFFRMAQQSGGLLLKVEGSEGPTRSYILSIDEEDELLKASVLDDSIRVEIIDDLVSDLMEKDQ